MQNHFKIIVPFYNVEKWIKVCIRSIKKQSYTNFQCILIDDFSDDNTEKIVIDEIKGDSRFSLVRPQEKAYALKNIYDGIKFSNPEDEDIIVTLDGDDWFASKDVLKILNRTYVNHDCWITYGSYAEYPSGKRGKFARPIDHSFIDNQTLRQQPWMSSHLRTFKAKLWNQIKLNDLLDSEGQFYRMTWDLAFMFPMLEMAGHKSKYIEDILYVYNMSNPMNDHKVDNSYQMKLEAEIRAKQPYERADLKIDTGIVPPISLYTASRFDLGAKIAYARDYIKNVECDWSKEVYLEHLRVWNNFKEKSPKKDCPEDFIKSFQNLISSYTQRGYLYETEDKRIPIIDVGPQQGIAALNGAHRIACANLLEVATFDKEEHTEKGELMFGCTFGIPVRKADLSEGQFNCGFEYFKNKTNFVPSGLEKKYLDFMNLEFVRAHMTPADNGAWASTMRHEGCRIVTLFPSANITTEKAIQILSKHCSVVSYKNLELNELGQFNYIMTLYFSEPWLGSFDTNAWPGAIEKQKACFNGEQDLRTILVHNTSDAKLRLAKEEIREICQKGNHSIHINDTDIETWRIASTIYNENSIHFLNNSKFFKNQRPFHRFWSQFSVYNEWQKAYLQQEAVRGSKGLESPSCPSEDFAIDASSVLSVYGIREGSDLDFLYGPHDILGNTGYEDISCHNRHSEEYEHSIHEMIYNPKNHFYFFGRKFVTLEVVKRMKQIRNEPKDQVDVKLIDEVLNGT